MRGNSSSGGFSGIKVLHVVYSLNRGGVETWLMHVLRRLDREKIAMDFTASIDPAGAYADEARALGARIHRIPRPSKPWAVYAAILRILREHGPYHAVHSHAPEWDGVALLAARRAGVAVRIAHCHTAAGRGHGAVARFYLALSRWLARVCATAGLACSSDAATAYFGKSWRRDGRWDVFHCGVDFGRLHGVGSRDALRGELGIPADGLVVGHVGGFRRVKNHGFWLQVAAAILKMEPNAWFVLVGDGKLRGEMERRAGELGIEHRTVFAGGRDDVLALLRDVMDVFLFPSLYEGLGLAVVEAQAAGLPCVIADTIPEEATIIASLVQRISLSASPEEWARRVVERGRPESRMASSESVRVAEKSRFALVGNIERLEHLYG